MFLLIIFIEDYTQISCDFDTPCEWFRIEDWTVQNKTIGNVSDLGVYYSGTVSHVLLYHDIIYSKIFISPRYGFLCFFRKLIVNHSSVKHTGMKFTHPFY